MESSTAERTAPPGTGTDPRGGFEVYPMKHGEDHPQAGELTGEYGWRFRSANGQITAVGGEGFTRPESAERAVRYFAGDVVKVHANLEVKHVEE